MSIDRLYVTMLSIADQRSLIGLPTSHRGKIGAIEGVGHELAHQLEMGRHFEERLRKMPDEIADKHEAAALRIEVAALDSLGIHLSLQRLWRDANWRGDPPRLTTAQRALSPRERRCVAAFVRIVTVVIVTVAVVSRHPHS